MTQIQETAITQRVEFASTELETASSLFSDFSNANQIMNASEISKIQKALGNAQLFISSISVGLEVQEELLKVKNKNKKDE